MGKWLSVPTKEWIRLMKQISGFSLCQWDNFIAVHKGLYIALLLILTNPSSAIKFKYVFIPTHKKPIYEQVLKLCILVFLPDRG
jgi:hypothetical protein